MSGANDALPADEPIVYRARATRWEDGWELLVEGVGATHVSSLDAAERRVREYIQTAMGVDTAGPDRDRKCRPAYTRLDQQRQGRTPRSVVAGGFLSRRLRIDQHAEAALSWAAGTSPLGHLDQLIERAVQRLSDRCGLTQTDPAYALLSASYRVHRQTGL